MKSMGWIFGALAGALGLASCAPTQVQSTYQRNAAMPRPEQVLVYDFAVSPIDVQLDRGLSGQVVEAAKGTPRTEQELQLGQKAARALSNELVSRINAMGLPARRVVGAPARWEKAVLIEGQFVSIDQGNSTERNVIGLGIGRSQVQTLVQVYETRNTQLVKLQEFATDAASGIRPGAAETMGVGAAAGTLGVSAAVTAAGTVGSELFGATVEADAQRTAANIADKLQAYFAQQGWIQPQ
jgi:hypothetical protein